MACGKTEVNILLNMLKGIIRQSGQIKKNTVRILRVALFCFSDDSKDFLLFWFDECFDGVKYLFTLFVVHS